VAFFESALFEFGSWSIKWSFAIVFPTFGTGKTIRLEKNFVDMFRVIRPVRRDMQRAVILQAIRNQIQEIVLHDTTLMMAFFWLRVGKIQVHSVQGFKWDLLRKHFDGVVTD